MNHQHAPVSRRFATHAIKSTMGTLGLAIVAVSTAHAQISSINSTVIESRVFNDVPGATGTYVNNYPGSITLGEANVSQASGYADRDVWYFSANGTSPYQFQGNNYFDASFQITLTGGTSGYDLEGGWLFSNPSGNFGGDLQSIVSGSGTVAQFGGPSYFAFAPNYVPAYTTGETYTMGLNYVLDPATGDPAFQYSVNGVFATSSPGDTYFDLASPGVGSPGDYLGGYFQIQNDPSNPTQSGQAQFSNISITSVPEPSTVALLGTGLVAFAPRIFRRRRV